MFIVMIRTSLLEKSNDGATPRHLIIITSRQYFGAVMYGGEGNSVSIIIIEYPDISRGKNRLVHLNVEDCSEELLPQQSYAMKNQLGHPKPLVGSILLAPRWFFMA